MRKIQFVYRKVIDKSAGGNWEKFVYDDSYTEYKMQSQLYDQGKKYKTFAELLQYVPSAEKLHFLVSTAITGYLQQLHGIVPDILNNNGKHFLPFKQYRFDIINSSVTDKAMHQVAVSFFSEPLHWHATVDDLLLVSINGKENGAGDEMISTEMVRLQPFFSIYSISK